MHHAASVFAENNRSPTFTWFLCIGDYRPLSQSQVNKTTTVVVNETRDGKLFLAFLFSQLLGGTLLITAMLRFAVTAYNDRDREVFFDEHGLLYLCWVHEAWILVSNTIVRCLAQVPILLNSFNHEVCLAIKVSDFLANDLLILCIVRVVVLSRQPLWYAKSSSFLCIKTESVFFKSVLVEEAGGCACWQSEFSLAHADGVKKW